MSSDAGVVQRWRARLKVRQQLLARARAKAAHRASQVAFARRVLARRNKAPTQMYDSVDLNTVPANAPAVAGYVGGRWPTYKDVPARFPHAKHLSIAIAAVVDAECLDVEPGDATPAQAAGWVKRQHARGIRRPVVYTSVSGAQSLVNELGAAGLPRTSYRLWTAHYTHVPHICDARCGFGLRSAADATQFTDNALGRNLDESRVSPGFWS